MLDFVSHLTVPSILRYAAWRAGGRRSPVLLQARGGERFELRPTSTGAGANTDYGVAYEIFALDLYAPAARLDRGEVRFVVDIGANVGFSVAHWLRLFPAAEILAYEPHPDHARQARRTIALNAGETRVELVEAGAGAAERPMVLSDAGTSSRISAGGEGIPARLADIFPRLAGRRIDLLKLDAEGGEYEVMADPRFATLDLRAIVMEWHWLSAEQSREWCLDRLASLGFTVEERERETDHGMLWATRAG
jgi:FkbM family methyltransferase